MIENLKEKLNKYIPSILGNIEEATFEEVYQTGLERLKIMQEIESDSKKISAPSFIEYIIHADSNINELQLHYIKEIDTSFKTLLNEYPQFTSKLKIVAERLLKAVNPCDVFDYMLDWENIAIELLVMTKLWKKEFKIKEIEYELDNGKSIDVYVEHSELGEVLCEFRSIHIDPSLGKPDSKNRKKVKDIIRKKIKDKTKDLNKMSLPAEITFLFIIQVQNGTELSQKLLKRLNTIDRKDNVLPLMICRLGITDEGKSHCEIVQIQDLIIDER
jgi:hypothetical protein